jgi:hypothetical protein
MNTQERISELEERREMACYQRKITTQLATVIEYDIEIGAIDRRLELLRLQLKKELKEVPCGYCTRYEPCRRAGGCFHPASA